jgi:hypothetical protein
VTTSLTWLRQLEAYVQEEVGAQARMLAALERQELALRGHDSAAVAASAQALEVEIQASALRSKRRDELIAALARSWNVAARALTLTSIVGRAGPEGERLGRARVELEVVTRRVQRLARRTVTAARFHQRITTDILRALLDSGSVRVENGGTLVDAEA